MLKINIDGLSLSKTIPLFSFLQSTKSGGMVLRGLFIYLSSIYTINNKIFCLIFNILHTKIPSHKFLNSLKYHYLLVK